MALSQFRKEINIMKKNVMMRAASALLVAVLLTTCAISGTFAKYTTSTTGSDKARVAYWGFDQDAATTIDLFDGEYNNVKASGEVDGFSNVIAPGTSKSTTFAFGYTNYKTDKISAPEVAYNFTVTPAITGDYDSLDANPNFKWTLQKGTDTASEYDTVADLLTAVKALSGDDSGTKQYDAGNLPSAFNSADETYTIGWEWTFETADNTTTDKDEMAEQDATDTAMGNADALENVTFTITISATQID